MKKTPIVASTAINPSTTGSPEPGGDNRENASGTGCQRDGDRKETIAAQRGNGIIRDQRSAARVRAPHGPMHTLIRREISRIGAWNDWLI